MSASDNLSVGFDITSILYNRGVSRYTTNIVRALGNLENSPKLRLFGSSFRASRALRTATATLADEAHINSKPSILAFPPAFLSRMWYGVGRLHIESLMPKVDVFHAWEELIPPSYKTPVVATIHDLALFKFQDIAHPQTKEKHQAALKRLLAYNSHVIAVSEQTKRDLLELFSFHEDHVHVVPEALPEEIRIPEEKLLDRESLKRLGIFKPFFLWVGINEPRKNLSRILEAWRFYQKDYDLVVVGTSGLHTIAPEPGLKVLMNVSREELASLYRWAEVLVFASLYEGFGLPILEAFQYGCPVVTSNNSGMKEVADDAGFLVDPFEVDSIQDGIKQALEKGKKQTRQQHMKQCLERYSWKESALATTQVYHQAAREGFHPQT